LSSRLDRIVLNANEVLNTNAFNENSFSIYPNPSNGVIKIHANSKNVSYQLISIQGRILEQGSLENNTLDFSNKAKGLYILRLSSKNNTTFIKRIVLE
jgi:hypothetical protein